VTHDAHDTNTRFPDHAPAVRPGRMAGLIVLLIFVLVSLAYLAIVLAYRNARSTASQMEVIEAIPIAPTISRKSPPPDLCRAAQSQVRCRRIMDFCLNEQDQLLVCDGPGKRIRIINPDDTLVADWPLDFTPEAIDHVEGLTVVACPKRIVTLDDTGTATHSTTVPGVHATGLAVSGDDVFVITRDEGQYRYTVYRTNRKLETPTPIITGLRGCCGQCDIAAWDGEVFVAANTLFKVVRYDRDGKELASFGKKRGGDDSFSGGCCEPKNVFFDADGTLYTAQSNGRVKKFTRDGQFLGDVGSATGLGGCVHVPIAVTRDKSRAYILDTGHNLIQIVQ